MAIVNYDGWINVVYSAESMKTRCAIDVSRFPFDQQNCKIVLGSWGLMNPMINLYHMDDSISTKFYTKNALWSLMSINTSTSNSYDRFSYYWPDIKTEDIIISIKLKRKPLNFIVNSIMPCFILNLITMV